MKVGCWKNCSGIRGLVFHGLKCSQLDSNTFKAFIVEGGKGVDGQRMKVEDQPEDVGSLVRSPVPSLGFLLAEQNLQQTQFSLQLLVLVVLLLHGTSVLLLADPVRKQRRLLLSLMDSRVDRWCSGLLTVRSDGRTRPQTPSELYAWTSSLLWSPADTPAAETWRRSKQRQTWTPRFVSIFDF